MKSAGYKVLVHRKTGTTEHPLREGGELVFGRDPDCQVSLSDGRVSRRHATLRLRDGNLELVDLGSRNGSVVDSERVAPNVVVAVRPTSVIRIGGSVAVFEAAPSASPEHWCFDHATFDKRSAALLATTRAQKQPVGLIEIRWESGVVRTTTTDAAPPAGLQQVLARIVGSNGFIGAHETGRLILLMPECDSERLDTAARLVKEFSDEHSLEADIRSASAIEARSIDALLEQAKRPGANAALVPPVIFHGALRSVDALLAKLDASDSPVLIHGETGVGKDVLARTLHARSHRANKPIVSLNCAAFTEALFESELFGHEKGAFTGAVTAKTGLLESAAGGTVFLDEIGEMPLGMQAKLLRVVENREVLRVGALQPKQIDVRFVFATNRDLRKEIELKTFRADLFFRIGSITLTIPPLRERVDEIAPLSRHFIEVSARKLGKTPPRLLPETQRFLEGHSWPGNVRELKNVIELAVLVHEEDLIRPADIHIERYVADDTTTESVRTSPPATPPEVIAPTSTEPKTEKEQILAALEASVWNQSNAAKLLGMPRRTLVKRLAQYDLPRPRKRDT